MNPTPLWLSALLLLGLSLGSFVEELVANNSRQELILSGLFMALCASTAVGLIRRAPIARPVASGLYLAIFVGCVFQTGIWGIAAMGVTPFSWEVFGRFAVSAVILVLVLACTWWLTSAKVIRAFKEGAQA